MKTHEYPKALICMMETQNRTTNSYVWISFKKKNPLKMTQTKKKKRNILKDIREHECVKKYLTNKQRMLQKNEKKKGVEKNCNIIHTAVNC